MDEEFIRYLTFRQLESRQLRRDRELGQPQKKSRHLSEKQKSGLSLIEQATNTLQKTLCSSARVGRNTATMNLKWIR